MAWESEKEPSTWVSDALICFAGELGLSRITAFMLSRLADSISMRPSWPPPRMPIVRESMGCEGCSVEEGAVNKILPRFADQFRNRPKR